MQIAHVGLRNIRSYRTAEVTLGPGTTLLTGDIGSGKTSLLYAMEMALFGFAEVDPGYLVRHGAKDAEVALTLTDGTHRWEWRRRIVRRSRKSRDVFEPTENSLAEDGVRRSYSATELRRRTIELLGFPDNPNPRAHSDVWRWAVYLAQERMRDVLDPDVEARMETVRKALGVEQYRLAGENARGLARILQERATDLAEQSARHQGVEDEAVRWHEAETAARQQLAALDERESGLRAELLTARAELERVEEQRRIFEAAREAVAHQERLVEELDRSLEQDRAAQEAGRERLTRLEIERAAESAAAHGGEEISPSVPSLLGRRDELVRDLASLEGLRAEASGLDDRLAQWTVREQELGTRHAATLQQLARARKDLARVGAMEPVDMPRAPSERSAAQLAAERNAAEEARRELDRRLATAVLELQELAEIVQDGVCPRCHRPVEASEFESHRAEQDALVIDLRRQLDRASTEVEGAEARSLARLEFERIHERWEQLEARRMDLRQREATLESTSAGEEGELAQLAAGRSSLETRRRALAGQLESDARIREQLSGVDQDLLHAEEQAQAAAARRERIAALERQIPETRGEIELRRDMEAERMSRRADVLLRIEESRNQLRVTPDLAEVWRSAKGRVDGLGNSLEGVLREMVEPRGRFAEATARLDDLTRRMKEREALERQSTQLGALSRWVDEEFRAAMIELERRRLQHGRLQFERRFAQYFAALVEDPSLSARVDETFAPWVDIAGQPTPAEALSGGERTALALAYRLALGRTVREAGRLTLETLILDEPTEGFSQEQTLRMGDLLEGLGLPQVILVSHERQLEGVADRVVRVRKKDGVSVVEEVDRASDEAGSPTPGAEEPVGRPKVPARRKRIRRLTDLEVGGPGDGSAQAR